MRTLSVGQFYNMFKDRPFSMFYFSDEQECYSPFMTAEFKIIFDRLTLILPGNELCFGNSQQVDMLRLSCIKSVKMHSTHCCFGAKFTIEMYTTDKTKADHSCIIYAK